VITREGIKPDPKKIQAILNLERPKTKRDVRRLIGLVQYYRDLWERRAHILAPFSNLIKGATKNGPIIWTDDLEKAFLQLKKMVVTDTMLVYPDFSKEFEIHTDASDYQLGATIRQNGKPIAFFSRKLTGAQVNYTITEKELLSIIECLKTFHNLLFGQRLLVIWTDHKNLVTEATISQSQRVQHWRLILEEYGPDISYIKGEENCAADALSRLPTTDTDQECLCTYAENGLFELFNSEKGEAEPMFGFPLNLVEVQGLQNVELNKPDKVLQKLLQDTNSQWYWVTLDGVKKLVMYQNRIYVPPTLQKKTLDWYHHFLCHPGGQRLVNTIASVCYYWKGLTYQA
jgi:hypothetical protein